MATQWIVTACGYDWYSWCIFVGASRVLEHAGVRAAAYLAGYQGIADNMLLGFLLNRNACVHEFVKTVQ